MGFYGNIINTTRTQFSFDRIYANKYEMFKNAETDGVYAGRYVLVEYDKDLSADSFISTAFRYNNNMYAALRSVETASGKKFYEAPEATNLITLGSKVGNLTVEDGTILRLTPGHNLSNFNEQIMYIQITGYDEENDSYSYAAVDPATYITWVRNNFERDDLYHETETLLQQEFESGIFYTKNESGAFVPAESYNPNLKYYNFGYGTKIFIINGTEVHGLHPYSNSHEIQVNDMFILRKYCSYSTNTLDELWAAEVVIDEVNETSNLVWNRIITVSNSNYYLNFNIDTISYPDAKRGYDSTVWQKVYSEGKQFYVMIAELNTITPNFAISAEAPTATPLVPHFDTDSTNMYYKVHWQPQWGFRVKAASNTHLGQEIDNHGIPSETSRIVLTDDEVVYPSDSSTAWKTHLYNTITAEKAEKYYNPETGKLEDYNEEKNYKMKSAIYFNKKGFDAENISYSEDLINEESSEYDETIAASGWTNENDIKIAPTGYSGNIYDSHNDNNEAKPLPDTQELSIMIPALGDNVAKVWDIVYGGRDTNDIIKETNKRNLDIFWEDAKEGAIRSGLRLVSEVPSSDGFVKTYNNMIKDENGNIVNRGEINTLAGCINSVHDLMGMILVNTTEEDLQNLQRDLQDDDTFVDYKNIDNNKIYYFSNDGTYRRRHETYDYTEAVYEYEPITLTADTFIKNYYYYKDGNDYIPSYDDDFDATREYYVKKIDYSVASNQSYSRVDNLQAFTSGPHFPYQKTLGNDYIYDESQYADDDVVYYNVSTSDNYKINVSGDYKPYTYYYYNDITDIITRVNTEYIGSWHLDTSERASSNIHDNYYEINVVQVNKNLEEVADYADNVGKYLYCPNYFFTLDYKLLTGVPSASNIDTYYKGVNLDITGEQEIYTNGTIYVPLEIGTDYEYDPNTGDIIWNTSLFNNGQVLNIYTQTNDLIPDKNDKMTKGQTYYLITAEQRETVTIEHEKDENGAWREVIRGNIAHIDKYRVQMMPYLPYRYYRVTNRAIVFTKDNGETYITTEEYNQLSQNEQLEYSARLKDIQYDLMTGSAVEELSEDYSRQFSDSLLKTFVNYYTITKATDDDNSAISFYTSNRFYYNTFEDALTTDEEKDAWEQGGFGYGDWLIDRMPNMTAGRRYYTEITTSSKYGPFYRPNMYYYYNDELQDYVLDQSENMQNVIYYLKSNFYVIEDKMGFLLKGAVWKYNNGIIPCIIKVGTRESIYEMQELKGFARTLNTIHGLILKINNLLEIDDNLTRDTNTIQGCINTMKDLIYRFDELDFNKMLVTNEYGRVVTQNLADIKIIYNTNKVSNLDSALTHLDEIQTMSAAEIDAIINS